MPPFKSIAVSAAFLSIAFFPASTWLGDKIAAMMTDTMRKKDTTLKHFILICWCVYVVCWLSLVDWTVWLLVCDAAVVVACSSAEFDLTLAEFNWRRFTRIRMVSSQEQAALSPALNTFRQGLAEVVGRPDEAWLDRPLGGHASGGQDEQQATHTHTHARTRAHTLTAGHEESVGLLLNALAHTTSGKG